jgi:general secretion pathway protein J
MTTAFHLNRKTGGAFTLIEVLVAISIFAILMVAIHTVFYSAIRMRNSAIDSLEASLPREQALQIMQRDLANIVVPNNATNGTFFGPLQTTNPTNAQPDQIGPDFYTSGGELDGMVPWGNVEKIDYLLSVPTNGAGGDGKDLIRAVTRNLLPITLLPQPDEKHTILSGVQTLTFLYWDGAAWDTSWDTTQQTNLPLAIKVQIQMAVTGGHGLAQAQPLEIVVPMDILLNTNPVTAIQ